MEGQQGKDELYCQSNVLKCLFDPENEGPELNLKSTLERFSFSQTLSQELILDTFCVAVGGSICYIIIINSVTSPFFICD